MKEKGLTRIGESWGKKYGNKNVEKERRPEQLLRNGGKSIYVKYIHNIIKLR
jgi:hypothetical protein